MGLFGLFGKKKVTDDDNANNKVVGNASENTAVEANTASGDADAKTDAGKDSSNVVAAKNGKKAYIPTGTFALGVEDIARIQDSDNLVVTGTVQGKVALDMEVYASNFGDDDGRVFETKVIGIMKKGDRLLEATDGVVQLLLEDAAERGIKPGTVIHTGDVKTDMVHKAYCNAIGNTYVMRRNFELKDSDFEDMSITDCAESWSMYAWMMRQKGGNISAQENENVKKKVEKMGKQLAKKIMEADEIYVPFSKVTGEPYMFSNTMPQPNGGVVCTPPEIMIITKAYKDNLKTNYPEDKFEIRKIENGDEGNGIKNFLKEAFYLNGARAAVILNRSIGISYDIFVEEPDWENDPEVRIPITNPDLVRWMLLIAQLGQPENSDDERNYQLYYKFMAREIVKAKLLVPMKCEGELPKPDQLGKALLDKNAKIEFPIVDGMFERQAVMMFTDWRHFKVEFGKNWDGMVQSVNGMIDIMDCAINGRFLDEKSAYVGLYIGADSYKDMKKLTEQM